MTLPTTNWVGVTLPGGFYYLVDESGDRLVDHDGNYLVSEDEDGTDWDDEIGASKTLTSDGGLRLVTEDGTVLTTGGEGFDTNWVGEFLAGGFYYIVDEDGNRLTDADGNYIVTEDQDGTTWSDE
jgi:hypothetical protein